MYMAAESITVDSFDSLIACGVAEPEWDEFLALRRAEVFHSYHWVRTWLETYGSGRTLRLFIVRRGGAIAGILSLFYEDHVWLASGSRVAKQVCADFGIASLSVPIDPEVLGPALDVILQHLFRKDRCDAVQFGPSLGRSDAIAVLRSVCTRRGYPLPQEQPAGISSLLRLPSSFEEYLASLSKNHRQNFRRSWNRLTREFQCEVEAITDPAAASARFGDFIAMHTAQWRERGEGGHFADWPRAPGFHAALLEPMARAGRFLLVAMTANGGPLSYQYCYGFGERLFWLLPARRVDRQWQQYGLGRLGFAMMAKAAIERGYREIDLGGAYWQYKSDLGGDELVSASILVCSGRASRLRLRWLSLYATALDIAYFRLWFKRIAPRFGWNRGALWSHWVRLASFAWKKPRADAIRPAGQAGRTSVSSFS